jgi:hypothetical protein
MFCHFLPPWRFRAFWQVGPIIWSTWCDTYTSFVLGFFAQPNWLDRSLFEMHQVCYYKLSRKKVQLIQTVLLISCRKPRHPGRSWNRAACVKGQRNHRLYKSLSPLASLAGQREESKTELPRGEETPPTLIAWAPAAHSHIRNLRTPELIKNCSSDRLVPSGGIGRIHPNGISPNTIEGKPST